MFFAIGLYVAIYACIVHVVVVVAVAAVAVAVVVDVADVVVVVVVVVAVAVAVAAVVVVVVFVFVGVVAVLVATVVARKQVSPSVAITTQTKTADGFPHVYPTKKQLLRWGVSNVLFPPFSPPWFVTKTSKIFVKEPPADMAQTNSREALSVSCGAAVRMLASSW